MKCKSDKVKERLCYFVGINNCENEYLTNKLIVKIKVLLLSKILWAKKHRL